MNLATQPIDLKDLSQYQAVFLASTDTPEKKETMRNQLQDFFSSISPVDIFQKYYPTHWRCFVELSWRDVGNFGSQYFADTVLAKQAPAAIAIGYDVMKEMLWNLHFRTPASDDMAAAYATMKKSFFESSAIVGLHKGVFITVKDLVIEITNLGTSDAGTLGVAETMSKIRDCFAYYNNNPQLVDYYVKPEIATDHFVGLVNFFLGVEPDRILYAVDAFVSDSSSLSESENFESDAIIPTTSVEEFVSEKTVNNIDSAGPDQIKVNYTDIKSMIEARFTRDASGEFTNLDGVLALLDSLATDQGDDQIRELYYFDEGAGKFQWNEALLT